MSDYQTLLYSVDDGLATLTLNRPERLNSFTVAMHEELRAVLDAVAGDDTIRCLLVAGAGRGFCAGQDLGDRAVTGDTDAPDLGRRLASGPTRGLALIKRGIHASAAHDLDRQLDLERDLQREAGRSGDYREGVAAFLEKREPRYQGR